jgi:hypothetical protein
MAVMAEGCGAKAEAARVCSANCCSFPLTSEQIDDACWLRRIGAATSLKARSDDAFGVTEFVGWNHCVTVMPSRKCARPECFIGTLQHFERNFLLVLQLRVSVRA